MEANGDLPPSYFVEFLQDSYAITQAVAIRRLSENNKDSVSLGRLLAEIRSEPDLLTRDLYIKVSGGDDHDASFAGSYFEQEFGGSTVDRLDPAVIEGDLQILGQSTQTVRHYVDKHVAHHDKNPAAQLPTYSEIDHAIDQICDLFRRYVSLLTAVDISLHMHFGHDWEKIFTVPWLERPPRGAAAGSPF